MKIIRNYSIRFPWRFNDRSPFRLYPVPKSYYPNLQRKEKGFIDAYNEILLSIKDNDLSYLKQIMEENIYAEMKEGLDVLKRRGQRIRIVNNNSPVILHFYNQNLYLGAHLERSKNTNIEEEPWAFKEKPINVSNEKGSKIPLDKWLLYSRDLNSCVLKIDVIFNTSKKLIIVNEQDDILKGESSKAIETHKFRFEKVIKSKSFWNLLNFYFNLFNYYVGYGSIDPFEDAEWVLTDIDDFLNGNPYTKVRI